MRLTITGLSSQYIHLPLAPFCLRRAVEEALPETAVTLCDLNVNETPETLLSRIMETAPEVVAVCVYIWNRPVAARLLRMLRALDERIVLVVGGPEVTWSVEETFREMPCDYLLRGADETSLPLLLRALQSGETAPETVPGLCFRTADGLRIGEVAPAPPPRDDLYDEAWQQALQGRMAYVETSRGCPFSCAFCLSGQREPVRFMPMEQALALLIRLGQSGTDTVKLIDRTFNCHHERTRYLLSGLIDARALGRIGEVCYHLEVAADLFDDAELALLSTAPPGLFQMEAGLQSFHPETLDACDRHTDIARLQDRLRRLIAPGNIHVHIDLIAGLPGEDFVTFGHSFDSAWQLRPHQLQLGFLKLIHGSRLRSRDWGQRFSPDPPYEVLATPWMTYGELDRLHGCADAVERLHNSGRFARTLALALRETGLRPFMLLLHLGDAMRARQGRWSLDHLTELIFGELLSLGVPEGALREALITDRLATDNTGHLPAFLQGDGEALKRAVRRFRDAHPDLRRPRCALLPDGTLLCAVWEDKHPVTLRCRDAELLRFRP